MDELTIGDKIYISSKQAAKITGYAKDYVGQLCREGRVEAKLVGRNWYVLESSIREHRFGAENKPHAEEIPTEVAKTSPIDSWQAPTYEAVKEEALIPPLEAQKAPLAKHETAEAVALMQDAWKEWFETRHMALPDGEEMLQGDALPAVIEEPEEEVIQEPVVVSNDEVRASDIPNVYAISEVSREEGTEQPIHVTRIEEVIQEPVRSLPETTRIIHERRVHAPVAPHVSGSVIDLSRAHMDVVEATPTPRHREARPLRRRVRSAPAPLTLQAVIIAVSGLSVLSAVIGSGALDSMLATRGLENGPQSIIFDALRGKSSVNK